MLKLIKFSSATLLLLIVIILINTLTHNPSRDDNLKKIVINFDEVRAISNLSDSIKFKTISGQNRSQESLEEFESFIQWLKKSYQLVATNTSLQRLNDTLLFKWEGSNLNLKPILVTGHYDVVPVIPGTEESWDEPPYSGKVDSEYVWGRGALDDKSGVIGILEAVTHLIESGFKPARTIYLSFGHDEEIGGVNGAAEVAKYLAEKGIQLEWSLDEGSFLLEGFIPGVDKYVAAINVAEKGSVTLQVVGKATGGHSSMPTRSSAVGHLSKALVALDENRMPGGLEGLSLAMFDEISKHMPFVYKMAFANRWIFGGIVDSYLSRVPATNAMLRTTTAPTMLSASVKTNVLPIEAIALVNFRIHPQNSVEDVFAHVRGLVENENVEVRALSYAGRPASQVSSWESEGYKVIESSVKEIFGDVIVAPGLMIAGSDTRHYGKVADNSYRFNPFPLSNKELAGFHGTNEKIRKKDFLDGIRAYIRIIEKGSST